MKAYVLDGIGALNYKEIEEPECRDGWALVEVKASGICSSDIPRIFTKGTYHFPTIPGHELSGLVKQVGNDKDSHWIGKRVSVFPLIPCRHCEQCSKGHYEMCANYDYVGSRRDGGFAEVVAVPVWNLVALSDSISYEEGALMEPLSVALHAVNQSSLQKGETVCVIGTGMIGIALGAWAKSLGASNCVILGRSEAKRSLVERVGLEYETDSEQGREYDVVFEAVGSNDSICRAIGMVKPGGRLVVMGNPEGDMKLPQDIWWRILRKQLHLIGTWNSTYESGESCDWSAAEEALGRGEIPARELISHLFPKEKLGDGLQLMKNHTEPYCKVMVTWDQEGMK